MNERRNEEKEAKEKAREKKKGKERSVNAFQWNHLPQLKKPTVP